MAAATGNTSDDQHARLSLRLAPRPARVFLLRAHLRLWLQRQHAAEDEILDILLAASEAFNNAVMHARQPRSIAVQVDASSSQGVVEIVIRDHGGWQEDQPSPSAGMGPHLMHALMDTVDLETTPQGTTVRMRRALGSQLIRIARERLELLGRNPIFAPLPDPMLERLAAQLIPFSVSMGETIIGEGAPGNRFYLIASGQVDVRAERRHVATLGPDDPVGEIALLRAVPRTATVVARQPVDLFALTREDFLSAVTSHYASTRAAESTVASRLTGLQGVLGHVPIARTWGT